MRTLRDPSKSGTFRHIGEPKSPRIPLGQSLDRGKEASSHP
jgi:hypothetical protein